MKKINALALGSLLVLCTANAFSYDVVNRYKLIDDKLKTEQMLRPLGHDFFLDAGVTLNKNLQEFVKDISDAGNSQGDKLVAASNILTKYEKTEQTFKINVSLGIPLFSFSIKELKIQPNIRAFVDAGANIGIRSDKLTTQDILDLFQTDLPVELKNYIVTLTSGDIMVQCKDNTALSFEVRLFCASQPTGKYVIPDLSLLVPNISLFAKIDAKVGLFNDYIYGDHFFGNFNLYGLSRTDIFQRLTKNMIASGSKIEFPKEKNTETSLQADYRLGYKNDNYRVSLSVEELKLNKMKERKVDSKALSYSYDPLIRLHADAIYHYSVLSLSPFFGFHKRSGYTLSDGIYIGSDAGAHVWGDRLGLQLRGMLDKQYITLSPRIKLWLMQLEYSLKKPLKAEEGDVKLSAIHSLDLRLFF